MAKRAPNLAAFDTLLPESLQGKIKLNDKVVWVKPETLTANPRNRTIFKEESEEYFRRLREDIQQRGILVPLVAKADGTILAGHNRLRVAQELALKVLPVQYVQNELSWEQEQEFIIKDNLYRRHLSQEDRIELYKKLFPTFEETFLSEKANVRSGRTRKEESRLTLQTIAETTGQKLSAVKMQVAREKQARTGANISSSASSMPKKNSHNVTISQRKHTMVYELEHQYASLVQTLHNISDLLQENKVREAKTLLQKIVKQHPRL